MSDLYFNEENDYSEENTSENEDFRSAFLRPFLFKPEQEKACGNEGHDKETRYIDASVAYLLHTVLEQEIPIGANAHIAKSEAREIDCICGREVDAMFIASTKIPEHE